MVCVTVVHVVLQVALMLLRCVTASFNLFMKPDEVNSLLGLNAELRYVNNGELNDYALGFVVLVPDDISALHFTWQSLRSSPIKYSIGFAVSNPEALNMPQLNISDRGVIPNKEEVFRVVLQCTGKMNAEVEVFMNINITVPPHMANATQLVLKRKKICLKSDGSNGTLMIGILSAADAMVAQSNPIYIGIGCAFLIGVTVGGVAFFLYLRTMKSRRTDAMHYGGSSPALSTTTQGHTFLRVETPNNASSASSYTSFKRLTPITTTTTSVQVSDLKPDATDQIAEIRIERHKIFLQEKLQEGTFGQIYHGIVRDNELASQGLHTFVKTVTDQASSIQVSLLTAEGMMMMGYSHKSILPLIGLCTDEGQHPLLLYPYMNQGNLKKFLHKCKFSAEGHCHALMTQDLVAMALQIVQGITFLHKQKVIHRDIATRNCVVDDWLQVKLADNALCRDLFPNDYHCLGDNENRPVKWLAIESLMKKEFSWASDVWAFGVTLWELMTLGQQPYMEIDPFEMDAYLRDGYRLAQPINCPDELFAVMACCWTAMPDERPTVAHLLGCLQDFYTALGRYI